MQCRDCQWYREQWHECCFGGGWGHYPDPGDWCDRYFGEDEDQTTTITTENNSNNDKYRIQQTAPRRRAAAQLD